MRVSNRIIRPSEQRVATRCALFLAGTTSLPRAADPPAPSPTLALTNEIGTANPN